MTLADRVATAAGVLLGAAAAAAVLRYWLGRPL